MSKELYVGNLPWSVNDESLRMLVASHMPVLQAKVVMDKETGRSRGFAFVTVNDEDLQNAISTLDGMEIEGRKIKVNESQGRQGGQGTGGQGRGPRSQPAQ